MKTSLVLCLLAIPSLISAQTGVVVNPTTVIFDSADHDTVIGNVPVVTNYVVDYFQGPTLVATVNAGKPVGVNGHITLALTQGGLAKNTVYTLYITAVGPGGSARSVASNPFCLARGSKGCN